MSHNSEPFHYSKSFLKAYNQLPRSIQKKVDRQLEMLLQNRTHPGLRVKKMSGVEQMWEGRVDQRYRFTFNCLNGVIHLRDVGTHAIF